MLTPGAAGTPGKEVRTFGTMTEDLERLVDWLTERGAVRRRLVGRLQKLGYTVTAAPVAV